MSHYHLIRQVEVAAEEQMEVEQEHQQQQLAHTIVPASTNGSQIVQIGTGDDKQFIEVPEGYTLIQTPNGLVMSQVYV